jgi:hypothetical protein
VNVSDIYERLRAPFPPDRVSWRVGSTTGDKKRGMALAYIDARDVMDRLDDVCGPAGWQCDYPHANGKTVCRIGLKIGDEWVWKADGAGDTDFEAEKGALSDAFKRAAVRWGIGRYLYDTAAPWVEIEPMGKSFKIKDSELARLKKLLSGQAASIQAAETPRMSADDQTEIHPPPPLSTAAKDMMAKIDLCQTLKALDNYGPTIAGDVAKLAANEQDAVRSHFAARKRGFKQQQEAA